MPFLYAKGYFINEKEKLDFFNNLIEDYARIIDIYNGSLENVKDIIEIETPHKITIKKSFY